MAQTSAVIEVSRKDPNGPSYSYTIEDAVKGFDYSSDALTVGEECHIEVVNERGRMTPFLNPGDSVQISLRNADVNGGTPTVRHRGVISVRKAGSRAGTISIVSCDIGWHLMSNSAPLWFNLRRGNLSQLADTTRDKPLISPTFGLEGVRFENVTNKSLKQGVAVARALSQTVTDPIFAVQAEPGESIYDILSRYAQRVNALVNVSVDGYLQFFNPDYTATPSYKFVCRLDGVGNNVEDGEMLESLATRYTAVEAVGERIQYGEPNDPTNPNATKTRGAFYSPGLLPFLHAMTFGDGESYSPDIAKKMARWRYSRGLYESWYVRYTVPEHHQGGVWFESDTMCEVEDEVLGIYGLFYVASVHCESSRGNEGDRTTLILRLPGLLSASYGVWKTPPVIRQDKAAQQVYASVASTDQNQTTTTANQSVPR